MWGNVNFRYRARPSRFEVIRRSISDRLAREIGIEAGAPVAHSWNCRLGHDLRDEPVSYKFPANPPREHIQRFLQMAYERFNHI